jgi:hypothetical protein
MAPPRVGKPTTAADTSGVFFLPEADAIWVAAFGDSLMWGQGLNRADRFSVLFTQQLGAEVGAPAGKPGALVWDASRSGAKIRDMPGERDDFADVYPSLFPDAASRKAFLRGDTDAPALGLYGEIPSTFPTILGQVKMLPPAVGRKIEIALVDGGLNDIGGGPEDIVNPLVATGRYIERYDGEIRRIVEDNVTSLLTAVRVKCPNALIMYFGFYSAISYESDPGELRALFKHEFNDDFKWWFNNYIYQEIDVNKMINEAMTRSLWFQGRWQYWTRRAVNFMAADDTRRGPGVVFVPSEFGTFNAGFTPLSHLWQDYIYPVQDPARFDRTRLIPRQAQLDLMLQVVEHVDFNGTKAPALAQKLNSVIDGPLIVKRDLQDYVNGLDGAKGALMRSLADEIHRIQHGLIASMGHPDQVGARGYSRGAVQRYLDHRRTMNQVDKELRHIPAAVGDQGLDGVLKKYDLRNHRSLAADVTNLDIDSLAVIVKTAPNSSRNLGLSASLVLTIRSQAGPVGPEEFPLTFTNYVNPLDVLEGGDPIGKPYPYLEPGHTNRLTVDAAGLKLSEIVACALVLGPDPWKGSTADIRKRYGLSWAPDSVTLEVNGTPVKTAELFGQKFGPGSHVDLGWPGSDPSFKPPVLKMAKIRRVRKLGKLATNSRMAGRVAP